MNYSPMNSPTDLFTSPVPVLFTGDAIYFRRIFYALDLLEETW